MAAFTYSPNGLVPVEQYLGVPLTGKIHVYYIDPTATTGSSPLFVGDPVVYADASSNAPGAAGNITALKQTAAASGQNYPIVGVFMGCEYFVPQSLGLPFTLANTNQWPGPGTPIAPGTLVKAYVLDDPFQLYTVQVNGAASSSAASAALSSLGYLGNFDFSVAGNVQTGLSGVGISIPTTQPTAPTTTAMIMNIPDNAPLQGNAPGVTNNYVNITLNTTWAAPYRVARKV